MASGSLSIWEEQTLINLANKFIEQVKEAIYNKPVERYTERMGNFRAPVNATGRLAASVQYDFIDNAIEVSCFSYVHYLLYGRRPGGIPPVNKIEDWIKVKGFQANPYAVAISIAENGTSIWQRWKGENSGLFDDVDIDTELKDLEEKLSQRYVSELADVIVKEFKIAA